MLLDAFIPFSRLALLAELDDVGLTCEILLPGPGVKRRQIRRLLTDDTRSPLGRLNDVHHVVEGLGLPSPHPDDFSLPQHPTGGFLLAHTLFGSNLFKGTLPIFCGRRRFLLGWSFGWSLGGGYAKTTLADLELFGDSSNLVLRIVRIQPEDVGVELVRRAETSAARVTEEVGISTYVAVLKKQRALAIGHWRCRRSR
jgi:hypothetical protein